MGDRILTKADCDQANPRTAHQWAFMHWPFLNDQGYTPAPDALEEWSERLDALGYVHGETLRELADENGMVHVDRIPEQRIKLRMPHRGQQSPYNGTLRWVDVDDEAPEPVVIPDPAQFTVHEQMAMQERMRYTGTLVDPEPADDGAAFVLAPKFDPGAVTPSAVNGYLTAMDSMGNDAEVSRVIAAEMMGKHRQSILRKWPGR